MDRLTKRVGVGEAVNIGDFDICKPFIKSGYCKTGMQGGFLGHWERHCNDTCPLGKMIDRLADYEDTGLMPEEVKDMAENAETRLLTWFEAKYSMPVGQLMAFLDACEEGRLVALPCKVGDTLFFVLGGKIYCAEVRFLRWQQHKDLGVHSDITANVSTSSSIGASFYDFGKTVFFTREEAEAALKGADHE